MKQVTLLKKNGPREYSLIDIAELGLIPWARDRRTIRNILEQDRKGAKILRAKVTGTGSQTRYIVDSTNLIVYLTTYGPALMTRVRKAQKKHG